MPPESPRATEDSSTSELTDKEWRIHQSSTRRVELLRAVNKNDERQQIVIDSVKDDPVQFINDWLWVYEPRNASTGLPEFLPFDLFDYQTDFINWLEDRYRGSENGLVEKARDMGFDYCVAAFYIHKWLFEPGFSGGLASYVEGKVDKKGDPDSFFEKLRIMLENLPRWMWPDGFSREYHDNHKRLINPENGNTIIGEVGRNAGRGGRSSMYVLNEYAWMQHAKSAERSASQTTDCLIYGSTPHGTGNPFAKKRHSGDIDVFVMDWREHPWKDEEWYEKQKEDYDEVTVAQEIDRDYSASVEGVCIEGKWVEAAINLYNGNGQKSIEPGVPETAGFDVADEGKNLNTYLKRAGAYLQRIESWSKGNPTESARKVARYARGDGVEQLAYDAVGVGAGVGGTIEGDGQNTPFKLVRVKGGASPTNQTYPDAPKERAADRFADYRTELWWNLRLRFQWTYEWMEGIRDTDQDWLIAIPNHHDLVSQLSQPTLQETAKGVKLESKKQMKKRGLESPDFADGLAYAFVPVQRMGEGWVG